MVPIFSNYPCTNSIFSLTPLLQKLTTHLFSYSLTLFLEKSSSLNFIIIFFSQHETLLLFQRPRKNQVIVLFQERIYFKCLDFFKGKSFDLRQKNPSFTSLASFQKFSLKTLNHILSSSFCVYLFFSFISNKTLQALHAQARTQVHGQTLLQALDLALLLRRIFSNIFSLFIRFKLCFFLRRIDENHL